MKIIIYSDNQAAIKALASFQSDSGSCRLCLEEDESTEHILCECGALVGLRREVLSREVLESSEIRNIPVRKIMTFMRKVTLLLN